MFNYDVTNPASILASVRSGSFDPRQTLFWRRIRKTHLPPIRSVCPSLWSDLPRVISEKPDEFTVNASMPQPGFLLLLDTYFPGWKATVNGTKAPILRADYNFRAVQLPVGDSIVCFTYQPASFRWGIALFFLALSIVAAVFFGSFKRSLIQATRT